ncbi:ROK family transcriptional regulator [Rhizobium sp. C4]|uniref:ROK family transcriptional regulator n=1 Tax=Rhizobium sp. C4 TaxID=1349800 RepID=UPI001E3F5345|nr:ROK family transcriptional regulator [Rhizobium sp. C4]MCD2172282.1 ROK family transcriptional regulator [Rhizobium sp. C4]
MKRQAADLSGNERMVLEIVRRAPGGIMRSALAPQTNLTQPSVHRIVDTLLDAGLLKLGETVVHGRGKPSPALLLNGEAGYTIGISVNTDCVSFGICDFACKVIYEEMLEDRPDQRRETLFRLKQRVRDVLASRAIDPSRLIGVGFSMAGFFVDRARRFNAPEPLRDWSLVDIRTELETLFDLPIWVENNGTTGAIGESAVGAGRRFPTFGYLSFNYGFGGGIVLDGRPLFGAFGNAGEISRVFTHDEGPSRPALGELLKRLNARGVEISNIRELRQRFDPVWPGVEDWIAEIAPALNRAIDMLRAVIDPEAIVFGGELPRALGERLLALPPSKSLTRYGVEAPFPTRLVSEIAGDPAILGAALIPLMDRYFLWSLPRP